MFRRNFYSKEFPKFPKSNSHLSRKKILIQSKSKSPYTIPKKFLENFTKNLHCQRILFFSFKKYSFKISYLSRKRSLYLKYIQKVPIRFLKKFLENLSKCFEEISTKNLHHQRIFFFSLKKHSSKISLYKIHPKDSQKF